MKGVLYLLRFFPKDIVQKIHRYLFFAERFHIPLQYKLNTHDVYISGTLSHETGPLHVRSIRIKTHGRSKSFVCIAFAVESMKFKLWLQYWENIMHAHYEEKGIKKKRCNVIRNNTLFWKTYGDSEADPNEWNTKNRYRVTKWSEYEVGKTRKEAVLYIRGVGWKHDEAKMKISLSF